MVAFLTALTLIAATPSNRAKTLQIPPHGLGGPVSAPPLEEPRPVTPSSIERRGEESSVFQVPAKPPARW